MTFRPETADNDSIREAERFPVELEARGKGGAAPRWTAADDAGAVLQPAAEDGGRP